LVTRQSKIDGTLELRLAVAVEAGAMFFDFRRAEASRRGRGWYAFAPVEAVRYHVVVGEGRSPEVEPSASADGPNTSL
jgi:hypothetical protein